MQVRKLTSTDAFVVLDLDGDATRVGVARLAPKVLVDGAELLARSVTYTFAVFGVRAAGASAGINAKPDGRAEAVAAFRGEVDGVQLFAGTGIDDGELPALDADLAARGAAAAAVSVRQRDGGGGGTGGGRVDRLAAAWQGDWLGAGDLTADADVLFLAGRAGIVDHEAAAGVTARVLVPVTPVPVTAKAYAQLTRAGTTYVPDFVSCAAPLLAVADPGGGDPVERVAAVAAELAAAGGEPWRVAVDRAERFLATWQPSLPFGRPLA